ncbi:MAG: cell surface protein SprA [Lewinellaceae bacterium]|nr:cell surface protein SprA [Lewinellaceae bacterium]
MEYLIGNFLGTFNLPRGSVRVSAGGRQLVEGSDYEIDYNIGRIKILNDAILQSGQNVNVSFEDNSLFGFQSRTMLGARFDYELGKDINIGATFMNLFERPLTQKVNFGDDPINNKVYGLDFNISKKAPWLTKALDMLPLIETKAESSITAQAEVAVLDPGHNRAINQGIDKGGVTYIDDFEGSTSSLPLTNPANSWVIASVPQGDLTLFPESQYADTLALGANRAGLSWYIADPSARDQQDGDDPYTRLIQYQDIFPNRQLTPLEQSVLSPLDVTYYPRERGPFHFELPDGYGTLSKGMTTSGELNEPATRWGGFMRGLNNNDFEAANIEFIEFWMLNPYMNKKDGTQVSADGSMYIDLGTVSEDIMRDSRQFFENALPTGQGTGNTVNTAWGRVPVLPPVVNAFDNDPAKRALQDVGLDGLNDDAERNFYSQWISVIEGSSLSPNAKAAIMVDPSNDNFVYFRDAVFDAANPGLLSRYRKFNNTQGNSPVNQTTNLNPSATNLPDMEDLNRDNSLNENEAYFRYKIQLKKTLDVASNQEIIDLNDPQMADLVTDTIVFFKNGTRFVWYRFKLPLDYAQRQAIGGIQDFRSIRFIRMFWKGFTERTTFRFATFELGRNQWRRFNQYIGCASDQVKPTPGPFDINSVSIEENAARTPFNYTIPFGIQREQSVGAFPDVLQNEQSLALTIGDLPYCEAKAIFKTLNMDLRQFKRMKMFVHAEKQKDKEDIDSTQLSAFIRIGSDFYNNYYEYEIPLTASNPFSLNGNPDSRAYKDEVWRPENDFDFPLQLLIDVKKLRNADLNWPVTTAYEIVDPENPRAKVRVVGNPNLGYVKGVMMGVRNVDEVTKDIHNVETWFNELRLVGFNEKGGYAGLARVDVKLADLGGISFAGNYTSIGWGSIEQKLIQRQREEVIQYDLSTNLELSKLLPEKVGLRLPFYAQYSNTTRNPEYDPYDLDIKLSDKIRDEPDAFKRDSIKSLAQDVTIVRGYNFTNVRKERNPAKKSKVIMPWAIENFSLSYAFNQQRKRTPFIIKDEMNQYKGGLDYTYSPGLKPITPFKKAIKNDKYLKFISEFNFNPLPSALGFNTNLERIQQVTTWRFAGEDPERNTYYNRRFTWDRNYDLNWDLTKSLRFSFDANARSIIDEPYGAVSKQVYRDSVWNNIKTLGRPKGYTHNASLNYTLPFKYIPLMDWITMKASYTTSYTWTAQSLKLQYLDAGQYAENVNSRNLGNVIQNNSTRQINGDFNFENLYKKSKYLAKIDKPGKGGSNRNNNPNTRSRDSRGGDDASPGGGGVDGRNPGGIAAGSGDKGKDASGAGPAGPAGRNGRAGGRDNNGAADAGAPGSAADAKAKKDKTKDRVPTLAERIAIRPLMLVRKARFTYSENFGTIIPGFTPETKLMGLSEGFQAPGWDFVAGFQPSSSWLDDAAAKGWITQRPELNQQVMRNYTQNFDASATIEPFADFRVEITASKQYARNSTELFKDQNFNLDPDSVRYEHRAQRDLGSFTVSYFALNTLFNNDIDGLFDRYTTNRSVVSQRLGIAANDLNPHPVDGPAYTTGYGKIQQEVLIPSFIAAYTDKDASTIGLDLFKTAPNLNWKLNYNGLSKLGNLKKIFASVQISHGYKSTLTVNSYNTDLFYDTQQPFTVDPLNSNYIARYEIPQIVISEQLAPLIGMDVKLRNDMSFRLDFKKARTLAMSFVDYQLAETQSTSYTAGFGYRLKDVNIPFLTGKKTKKKAKSTRSTPGPPTPGGGAQAANDMTFKFDFDYRDDITVNHRLDQLDQAVPTRGARTISINPSVDYTLNRRLKLRLFTDFRKTVPKTSQSFPITTINSGVTVQFTLN